MYEFEYSVSYIDKNGKLLFEVFIDSWALIKFLNEGKIKEVTITVPEIEYYYDEPKSSLATYQDKEDIARELGIHYCEESKRWS